LTQWQWELIEPLIPAAKPGKVMLFSNDSRKKVLGLPDYTRFGLMVVLRPKEHKGFILLAKRWVVERTFGWLSWCRRLSRDHEGLPETSEIWIYIAMIRMMVRRLA
jgi:Transposase DDE domain